MKAVEMAEATASLAEFAREAAHGPVIVMEGGKPIAALVPLGGADWESVALSLNPEFQALIEESRARHAAEGGLSTDEVRELLGLKKPSKQPRVIPGKKSAV